MVDVRNVLLQATSVLEFEQEVRALTCLPEVLDQALVDVVLHNCRVSKSKVLKVAMKFMSELLLREKTTEFLLTAIDCNADTCVTAIVQFVGRGVLEQRYEKGNSLLGIACSLGEPKPARAILVLMGRHGVSTRVRNDEGIAPVVYLFRQRFSRPGTRQVSEEVQLSLLQTMGVEDMLQASNAGETPFQVLISSSGATYNVEMKFFRIAGEALVHEGQERGTSLVQRIIDQASSMRLRRIGSLVHMTYHWPTWAFGQVQAAVKPGSASVQDYNGSSAAHVSLAAGCSPEAALTLIEIVPPEVLSKLNSDNVAALHCAAMRHSAEVVEAVLAKLPDRKAAVCQEVQFRHLIRAGGGMNSTPEYHTTTMNAALFSMANSPDVLIQLLQEASSDVEGLFDTRDFGNALRWAIPAQQRPLEVLDIILPFLHLSHFLAHPMNEKGKPVAQCNLHYWCKHLPVNVLEHLFRGCPFEFSSYNESDDTLFLDAVVLLADRASDGLGVATAMQRVLEGVSEEALERRAVSVLFSVVTPKTRWLTPMPTDESAAAVLAAILEKVDEKQLGRQNHMGRTVLHEAVSCGFVECVKLLLGRMRKQDVQIKSSSDRTAEERAKLILSQDPTPAMRQITTLFSPMVKGAMR